MIGDLLCGDHDLLDIDHLLQLLYLLLLLHAEVLQLVRSPSHRGVHQCRLGPLEQLHNCRSGLLLLGLGREELLLDVHSDIDVVQGLLASREAHNLGRLWLYHLGEEGGEGRGS